MEEVKRFHGKLEEFRDEIKKRHTKTISDQAFKKKAIKIYTEWKTDIHPLVKQYRSIRKPQVRKLDQKFSAIYRRASSRITETKGVQLLLSETTALLFKCLLQISTKTHVPETRESLINRLNLELKHFEIASDYFEEAKSCFKYGLMRASTIVAISALESCLKTDYLRLKHEEFDGKLFNLLNRYFSGDIKRLPKQYEDFSKTYVKIRNSFTHPEEFDFSENIVHNVLCTVAELMKAIEKYY